MRRRHLLLPLCGFAALLAVVACTEGGEVTATFSHSEGGGSGEGGDGEGAAGGGTSTQASTASSSSSTTTTSGAGGHGEGGSGNGGAGAGSGSGGGGGEGAGCDYSAPNSCAGATEINTIDGDTGSDTRTVTGTTSKWFKIVVHEGSLLDNKLSFTAAIDSPPGMNFDLFAYVADTPAPTQPDCLGEAFFASGDPESVSMVWGDTFGVDDDWWFALEVRYISGEACDAAAKWTLTVQGNTIP